MVNAELESRVPFSTKRLEIVHALLPILKGTKMWEKRAEVEWYVGRCLMAGVCDNTLTSIQACAKRYVAGKRKVSRAGAAHKKRRERTFNNTIRNVPEGLMVAIKSACQSKAATEYMTGNDKALNAVLGQVMREYKADAEVIKTLLQQELKKGS